MPARRPSAAFLLEKPFAHRGLHGGRVVENSLEAFDRAMAAGHGIELDVQLTADGDAVVFHDATLDRLCGRPIRVDACTRADLAQIALTGTQETIHSLHDVLRHIDGRVPVLIEVKTPQKHMGFLCQAVRHALEGYVGPVAVMAFHPEIVRWFRVQAPYIVRGLVVSDEKYKRMRFAALKRWVAQALSMMRAHPDFLAYDIKSLPSPLSRNVRQLGLPLLSWTVRSPEERARALDCADQIIYEVADARPRS